MAQQSFFPSRGAGFPWLRRRGFGIFCVVVVVLIGFIVEVSPARSRGASARPDPAMARLGREALRGASASSRPRAAGTTGRSASAEDGAGSGGNGAGDAGIQRLIEVGEPIYCGAGTKPLVALTFDDGPGSYTQATLDLLSANGMTATFFTVGKLYADPRFTGLLRKEARLGAVGDHTWDHVPIVGLSASQLESQIGRTRTEAARLSGEPVFLVRPPLGRRDATVDAYARSQGMLDVLWSIDSRDSLGANANQIYETVAAHLSPGDIILFHENRGTTQLALPLIIEHIRELGYQTVTVPELLAMDPPSVAQLREHACP